MPYLNSIALATVSFFLMVALVYGAGVIIHWLGYKEIMPHRMAQRYAENNQREFIRKQAAFTKDMQLFRRLQAEYDREVK